jgi:phage baseplate assembly protein W
MQPNLGGNIRAMLFENITPAVLTLIEDQVRTTIELYEPRAELIDVIVSSNIDDNIVKVTIVFYVKNNQQPISVDVFLERTR